MSARAPKIVNVASVPQRSLFRYPGGKTWFVPQARRWLDSMAHRPKLLIEPFAGGGIIGLTAAFEGLVDKVLLIELDEHVASVWEVLINGDADRLARQILDFDLTESNVRKALDRDPKSTLEKAFQTILRNRVSHGGIMAPGSGLIRSGENGRGLKSRWYPQTLANRIADIERIRDRLQFIRGSAFELIPAFSDSKETVFFVDPPYTAGGKNAGRRLYGHHQLDHSRLFDLLQATSGDCLVTYSDATEIRKMARDHKMECRLVPMKNTHHTTMKELIIARDLSWMGR